MSFQISESTLRYKSHYGPVSSDAERLSGPCHSQHLSPLQPRLSDNQHVTYTVPRTKFLSLRLPLTCPTTSMLSSFRVMFYTSPILSFPHGQHLLSRKPTHGLEIDRQANTQRRGWEPIDFSRIMAFTASAWTQQDNVWLQTGITFVVPHFRVYFEMLV